MFWAGREQAAPRRHQTTHDQAPSRPCADTKPPSNLIHRMRSVIIIPGAIVPLPWSSSLPRPATFCGSSIFPVRTPVDRARRIMSFESCYSRLNVTPLARVSRVKYALQTTRGWQNSSHVQSKPPRVCALESQIRPSDDSWMA